MNVRRLAGVMLLLVPLWSGCLVTKSTYDAELARSRSLEHGIAECREHNETLARRNRDLLKTGENLELERTSLEEERIQLLESLETLREGNEKIELELAVERRAREAREAELAEVSVTYRGLVETLEGELASGKLEIQNLREGIQVRASDEILFASGEVEVKPEGKTILAKVAQQIQKAGGHHIRVEGHTDNVPIATARFPSNWELSSSRAAGVVRFMVSQGVDQMRISAAGFAEQRPIESNDSPAGRSRNRRIEIMLIPDAQ